MDTLKQLEAIPDLATEAYLTWNAPNPGDRTGFTKRPRPGSKAPTDLAVLDALRPDPDAEGSSLRGVLSLAVRAVWEGARTEGSPTPDLEPEPTFLSECRWLTETVVFWHSDRRLDEYVTDSVATVHRELAKLVRMPKPVRLVCPRCHFPVDLKADGAYYQCEAGHIIDHHAEIRRMGQLQEMSLSEISERTNIPEKTLHRWARDGWISPVDAKRRNRVYVLGDVQLVAERVRRGRMSA